MALLQPPDPYPHYQPGHSLNDGCDIAALGHFGPKPETTDHANGSDRD